MSSGAEQPPQPKYLRRILKTVAGSDRLRHMLSLPDGPERVLADPEVAPDAAHLTPDVRDALIAGDLCQIQEALDNESQREDTDAAVRSYWALVRI